MLIIPAFSYFQNTTRRAVYTALSQAVKNLKSDILYIIIVSPAEVAVSQTPNLYEYFAANPPFGGQNRHSVDAFCQP